jgi:hypothetical protein
MSFEAAAILAVGSSLLGAGAAIDSGKSQQVALEFNANVNERNAVIAEQRAEVIKRESDLNVQDIKGRYAEFRAMQERTLAMNGWDADTGTGLQLQIEAASAADQDIANLQYNTAIAQAQVLEGAVQERIQADLNRLYGKQAVRESEYRAAGTLLSGATKAATLYGMA